MRACVTDEQYKRVFTWYDDGTVHFIHRDFDDMHEAFTGIYTMAAFNEFLERMKIRPLGAKVTQQKELDLWRKEIDKVPF